jgi:hypothetical protein
MVAAAIRTIFAQPDPAHVRAQVDEVARMLDSKFPDVAGMLAPRAAISPMTRVSLRRSQRVAAAMNSGMANSNRSCWARLVCSLTQRWASSPLMAPV